METNWASYIKDIKANKTTNKK